jgi:5-methylcytosine-specific restriction endonuclease McrA
VPISWARQRELLEASAEIRSCAYCVGPFPYHPKLRATYCSPRCRTMALHVGKACVVPWAVCRCGEQFIASRRRVHCRAPKPMAVCHPDRVSDAGGLCRACYRAAHEAKPLTDRHCAECGHPFQARGHRKFCSAPCSKRAANRAGHNSVGGRAAEHRRRYRLRGAVGQGKYDRAAIFGRDHWRCQLCGAPVERHAAVPHPMAPTIDHIVALAHGGSDEWTNVRLAHFLCNARRGTGTGGRVDTYLA